MGGSKFDQIKMKPFEVFRYNWQNNTEVRLQNPPLPEVPQTLPVDT